jgi:predicted nucleotidyltransferase
MTLPNYIFKKNKGLSDWCILLGYRGSIAHGMYIPNSDPNSIDDKDLMAVCVPPIDHYLGLKQYGSRGTKEIKENEWDIVIYEATKMIRMLMNGNPNVLSMLWLEDKHYIKRTKAGQLLIDNRDLFVGKHVYKSFVGYASGQLKRMTHFSFEGYMGEKRKKLVDKYKFDVKNASHLIRILRMGIEFLIEGKLTVERFDSQQLLEIKRGEWSLEKVKKESDRKNQTKKK